MLYFFEMESDNGIYETIQGQYKTKAEAIKDAKYQMNRLTRFEVKHLLYARVIKRTTSDENAENFYDGNIVFDALKWFLKKKVI